MLLKTLKYWFFLERKKIKDERKKERTTKNKGIYSVIVIDVPKSLYNTIFICNRTLNNILCFLEQYQMLNCLFSKPFYCRRKWF